MYVSKLARVLDVDGLIGRTRDPVDARTIRLALTDRGREAIRLAMATVRTLVDQLLQPLGGHGDRHRPVARARQIPLDGEPAELVARIEAYYAWLAASVDVSKLLMTFEGSPTLLVSGELAAFNASAATFHRLASSFGNTSQCYQEGADGCETRRRPPR